MKELHHFEWGYSSYPPSILIVGDNAMGAYELNQRLEKTGMQVHLTDARFDGLKMARQSYFELIVLDLEGMEDGGAELYQKIKTNPQLSQIPIVILTSERRGDTAIKRHDGFSPVSYFSKDDAAEEKLCRLIEQTHYMAYRYM